MSLYAEIHAALGPGQVPEGARDIQLPYLDANRRLGVGRASDRALVLVGPGQPRSQTLEGSRYLFEPWTELVDTRSNVVLKDVCILRFRPDDELSQRDAAAAVFAGLTELASAAPDTLGAAVTAMRALFEAGLQSTVARDTEIGLAGELLTIADAADPNLLAPSWHAQPQDQFDFSAQGERLDVKTTTSAERVHWFSSGQVTPIPGVCTSFVSLQLPIVETGSTVASLFADMASLSAEAKAEFRRRIIETVNEPPELLTSVVFDRIAARASMLHLAAAAVPRPTPTPGVGRMRWEAAISLDAEGPGERCAFARALHGV